MTWIYAGIAPNPKIQYLELIYSFIMQYYLSNNSFRKIISRMNQENVFVTDVITLIYAVITPNLIIQ